MKVIWLLTGGKLGVNATAEIESSELDLAILTCCRAMLGNTWRGLLKAFCKRLKNLFDKLYNIRSDNLSSAWRLESVDYLCLEQKILYQPTFYSLLASSSC